MTDCTFCPVLLQYAAWPELPPTADLVYKWPEICRSDRIQAPIFNIPNCGILEFDGCS